MFDEKGFLQNSKNFFIISILVCGILLFSNVLEFKKNILEIGTFFVYPIQNSSYFSSNSLKDFFGVFSEIKTLRSDYYELEEDYLRLKSESGLFYVLEEENMTLKKELGFEIEKEKLVMAEVLFQDLDLRNESLIINKGLKDGVFQGDIVVIGDLYIGIITEVYDFTSKVRLPTSRASSLKVMIVNQEHEDWATFSPRDYLSGIAVGYTNTLKIENIEIQGDLREGYFILINDAKVGTYLYLGEVLHIDDDPTLALRSCTVGLPIDYANLKYVFIRRGN